MNLTIIQKSIDYIEDNLKTDITAKVLSEMAGFSMFHYYRLFQSAVGIRQPHLIDVMQNILCGLDVVVGIALQDLLGRQRIF